jgi:alkyl hydroperoxide reductase subunit AhpC
MPHSQRSKFNVATVYFIKWLFCKAAGVSTKPCEWSKHCSIFEENGEVCPANWQQGKATIKPNPAGSQEFFEKEYA